MWKFHVRILADGTLGSVARTDGGNLQLLRADGWHFTPGLLGNFHDGDYDEVDESTARRAAAALGFAWPTPDVDRPVDKPEETSADPEPPAGDLLRKLREDPLAIEDPSRSTVVMFLPKQTLEQVKRQLENNR